MKKSASLYKLQHPLFLFAVILLLCNDFYLKNLFGNTLTGKLSDFTGLFAFPFFFSCIFTTWKKIIHIATLFLFVWWKSSVSQPFIDFINGFGIPIGRVVDFTDNVALLSVVISYFIFIKDFNYRAIKPIWQFSIMILTAFSFTATSLAPRTVVNYASVDKIYTFDMPMETLIERFNALQKKAIEKMSYMGVFDEETGVFYSNNKYKDTLAYIIDIKKYDYLDTIFISNYLSDIQIYRESDTITILKLMNVAIIELSHQSEVKKIDSVNIYNARDRYPYPVWSTALLVADTVNESKLQKKAVNEFEKRIIKKLKR